MWKMLAAPVIGAIIGYCTNWLAVKMLFRPREAKYIGKFHVPFTPGVIPKGKSRLAGAVSNVINEQLLTKESIEARLLSDEVTDSLKTSLDEYIENMKNDDKLNIRQIITVLADDETDINIAVNGLQEAVTTHAVEKLKDAQLGAVLSDNLMGQLNAAMENSFLGKMIGESMMPMIGGAITRSVDTYVDQNAESIVRSIIKDETENLLSMPAEKIINGIESSGYDISGIIMNIYRKAVKSKAGSIISMLNIGEIARSTIENMDNSQLEDLVMSTMKTELRAIVNLGALIGLILGLVNMLIYIL